MKITVEEDDHNNTDTKSKANDPKKSEATPLLIEHDLPDSVYEMLFKGKYNKSNREWIKAIGVVIENLKTAIPMAASFTFSFSLIVTTIAIAHMANDKQQADAEDYLAAATLITSMTQGITLVSASTLFPLAYMIGEIVGNIHKLDPTNDAAEINKLRKQAAGVLNSGLTWSVGVALPFAFSSFYFSDSILTFFQQPTTPVNIASRYLSRYAFAMPGFFLRMCVEQVMFAFGKAKPAMYMGLSNFIIGVSLGLYLTFGPPKLGVEGIATGFAVEAWTTAISFLTYIMTQKEFKDFRFLRSWQLNKNTLIKNLSKMFKIGWPMTLQNISEMSALITNGILAGWLGTKELAAQNFISLLYFMIIIPVFACSNTAAIKVSELLGKKNYSGIHTLAKYSPFASLMLNLPLCLTAGIYPESLRFISYQGTGPLHLIRKIVPLAAIGAAAIGPRDTAALIPKPTQDNIRPTSLVMTYLWLGVGLAWLFGVHLDYGLEAVTGFFTLGIVLGMTLAYGYSNYTTQPHRIEQRVNHESQSTSWLTHLIYCCVPKKEESTLLVNSDNDDHIDLEEGSKVINRK